MVLGVRIVGAISIVNSPGPQTANKAWTPVHKWRMEAGDMFMVVGGRAGTYLAQVERSDP